MILEAFKLVTSVFPFIKEMFLWRDGAEEGKPVTKQNLIRRKVAVFVLLGSIVINYVSTGKLVEYYKQNVAYKEQISVLESELKDKTAPATCIKPEELSNLLHKELEQEFNTHLPKKKRKSD